MKSGQSKPDNYSGIFPPVRACQPDLVYWTGPTRLAKVRRIRRVSIAEMPVCGSWFQAKAQWAGPSGAVRSRDVAEPSRCRP